MTDQTVFQIHYRDGRVEGPLGTQVVIDLINAGVIQHDDMLCPPGGHPAPASAWPAFAACFSGQEDSGEYDATSMMSLDDLAAGFGRELADLAEDWGDSGSTVQMEIPPSGGLFPGRKTQAPAQPAPQPTTLKPAPDLDDGIIQQRISVEVDDLFSVAGSTPSGSNIPRKAAPTVGKSYSSTSGSAFPSAIAVPNPFAKRPVRDRPTSGAGISGLRSRSSTSGALPTLDPLWKKSAQEIRQKLLEMPLTDILGVAIDTTDDALAEAHRQRRIQVAKLPDIQNSSIMVRAAVFDLITIVDTAFTLLSNADDRDRYIVAGTDADFPAFRDFATFSYAPVKPLEPNWDPLKHGVSVEASPEELGQEAPDAGAASSMTSQETFGLGSSTSQDRPGLRGAASSSTSAESDRLNPAALQERPATQRAPAQRRQGQPTGPSKPPARTPGKAGSPAVTDRRKRLKEFKGSAFQEDGDPFKGPLAFGVGVPSRGLAHTIPVFIAVFAICFALVSVLGLGEFEFQLRPDEKMIYARGGVLALMTLLPMLILRRESPARLGWKPNAVATVLAIPFAAFVAAVAAMITPLPLEKEGSLPMILGLLAIRGIAEPLFFQGFLTRTLLIEFRDPVAPVFITALCYGLYSLTFLGITDGPPLAVIYGVVVWGFGAGIPYSVIYWRTRSILIVMVCELIILLTVALSSWADVQAAYVPPPG